MKTKYLIAKIANSQFLDEGTILREPCYIIEHMDFDSIDEAKAIKDEFEFSDDFIIVPYYI